MMSFLEKIRGGMPFDPAQVAGYSEEEIEKIERLYEIKVSGVFKEYLLEMGRCDGGLIGDDPIWLYREHMTVRRHLMFQMRIGNDFKEYRIEEGLKLLKHNLFTFSVEGETQYYFLATTSEAPDRVWHYDENNETVEDMECNFLEYMRHVVKSYGGNSVIARGVSKIASRGELLLV